MKLCGPRKGKRVGGVDDADEVQDTTLFNLDIRKGQAMSRKTLPVHSGTCYKKKHEHTSNC
jgi:hypothetical protein